MSIRIRIADDVATITRTAAAPAAAPAAFRTALIEARGALLEWSVASGERFPDADIHSPIEASAWLSQIYGDDIAAAVRDGDDAELPLPEDAELVDAARRLAELTWARDWWPAGVYTPALSAPILAAETAVAAHTVAHLLDDEDAVERAVLDAIDAPSALAAVHPSLRADAATLIDALTDLADDHGVDLSPALLSTEADEWALAAGAHARPGDGAGAEISQGTAPVRWADVPAQTVAADSDAQWALQHIDGVPHLQVSVAAVPGPDAPVTAQLWARFGPEALDIDIPLTRDGSAFTGAAPVPASVALLPPEERTLWVRDPRLAAVPSPAEPETDRDRVREFAVERLDDPQASLAERAAGAEG